MKTILHAYMDDSGSGEGKDRGNVSALAGFASTPEDWELLIDEWAAECNQAPATPNFKMYHAAGTKTYNWTSQQRMIAFASSLRS